MPALPRLVLPRFASLRVLLPAVLMAGLAACATQNPDQPTVEVARALGGSNDLGTRNLARINTGGMPVQISVFSRMQREYDRAWTMNYAQQQQRGRPTPSGRF